MFGGGGKALFLCLHKIAKQSKKTKSGDKTFLVAGSAAGDNLDSLLGVGEPVAGHLCRQLDGSVAGGNATRYQAENLAGDGHPGGTVFPIPSLMTPPPPNTPPPPRPTNPPHLPLSCFLVPCHFPCDPKVSCAPLAYRQPSLT